jgi:hypothetical protein
VIDEEVGYITGLGMTLRLGERVDSLKALLTEAMTQCSWAPARPRGRDLDLPGREEGPRQHPHRNRLAVVGLVRAHRQDRQAGDRAGRRQHRHGLLPHLAPAWRRGRQGESSAPGFDEMKASPWEKEDAIHEDIPILNYRVPTAFTHENGKLTGVLFEVVEAQFDEKGRRKLVPAGVPDEHYECERRAGRRGSGERLPLDGNATSAWNSTSGTCRR